MDLETIIRTLETAGYAAVELCTIHKHGVEPSIGPEERDSVRERFQRSKVRLLSYGTADRSPDGLLYTAENGNDRVRLHAGEGCGCVQGRC
jgi:hypothetical protein